ncbi:MAG: hypothetical protein EOP46_06810 [Sphingobacteriaceae bacterium]|nr:MAG: hypothetical protein EOP46_06810 [Sphingobacteriaceae bacterium]
MSSVIRGAWLMLALFSIITPASAQKRKDYTPLVNPFIGTSGAGHTYPAAVLPYGMARLNPETRANGSGYGFLDEYIYGFSHTRYTSSDTSTTGEIIFMPTTGEPTFKQADYRSKYIKKNEKATPGYYKVKLDKYEIIAELAATQRAGLQVYDYPSVPKANILVDLQTGGDVIEAEVEVISNHEIQGFRKIKTAGGLRQVYFYSKFSKSFSGYGINLNDVIQTGKNKVDGKNIKMFVQFDNPGEVAVKTGLSYVSTAGALKNLDAEIPGFEIDKVQKAAKVAWNTELSRIYVEGGAPPLPPQSNPSPSLSSVYAAPTPQKKVNLPDFAQMKLVNFYTAFYHTMLTPSIANDVDGQYHTEDKTASAKDFTYYDVSGLYNNFGQHYQLITLIDSTRTVDIIKSYLISPERDSTATFAAFAADSYAKGIKGFDTEQVYNTLKKQLDNNKTVEAFRKNGYLVSTNSGSVAKTLTYAYNYYCLAQLAKLLNKTDDQATYLQYAQYWKNLYNPKTGFLQARQNGGWPAAFDPTEKSSAYNNNIGWLYTFQVPHDAETLAAYIGGKDLFEAKLDEFLVGDKNAADSKNTVGYFKGEGINGTVPYLYNLTGAPQKSQFYINRIIRRFYQSIPDGLTANDINSEVSAWYVLSSLGLYTITPGQEEVQIGFPQFEKIIIKLPAAKTFTILNSGAAISLSNNYIQGMNLNKNGYNKLYLTYTDITKGGELEVFTGTMPNKLFMQDIEKNPLKVNGNPIVPKPYINIGVQTEIFSVEKGTTIYYTTDGSIPTNASKVYSKPFAVTAGTTVKAIAVLNGVASMYEEALLKK